MSIRAEPVLPKFDWPLPPAAGGAPLDHLHPLLGDSAPLERVRRDVAKLGKSDAPVLITGETGTGKEVVARNIHLNSKRAAAPFIPVNCGGLPPTLIASELFGHEKGAFTGAIQKKIGKLEAANGGTLFLDEIGDLDISLQPFFLRFLQESTIDRLGAQRPIPVNVRILAATNKTIEPLIEAGKFREDLYYRLRMLSIHLPPLRDCRSDILPILKYYMASASKARSRPVPHLTKAAEASLVAYYWPGNVRELIGRVHRAVATAENGFVTDEDFGFRRHDRRRAARLSERRPPIADALAGLDGAETPDAPTAAAAAPTPELSVRDDWTLATGRDHAEAIMIRRALRKNENRLLETAETLDVSRATLYRLMKKHGISVPDLD
jgi:DNA-binding NtrC family response regulator